MHQINLELTNKELDKEIDNHTVNQRYSIDLFSKGPEITRSEIVMREVYSWKKRKKQMLIYLNLHQIKLKS